MKLQKTLLTIREAEQKNSLKWPLIVLAVYFVWSVGEGLK